MHTYRMQSKTITREVYISFLNMTRSTADSQEPTETQSFLEVEAQKLSRFTHADLVFKAACKGDQETCEWVVRDQEEKKYRTGMLGNGNSPSEYTSSDEHPNHFHMVSTTMTTGGFSFLLDRAWSEEDRGGFIRKYTIMRLAPVSEEQYQNILRYVRECRRKMPVYNKRTRFWIMIGHIGMLCSSRGGFFCRALGWLTDFVTRICCTFCCCGWWHNCRRKRAVSKGPEVIADDMINEFTCPSFVIGAARAAGGNLAAAFSHLDPTYDSPDELYDACVAANFKDSTADIIRDRTHVSIYDAQGRIIYLPPPP